MIVSDFGGFQSTQAAAPQMAVAEEVIDSNKFFDFEARKVQVLTLDQLERTNRENRGDDRSCPHGIYHFALLHQILDMAAKEGYNAEVYDLFATNNKDKQTPGVSLYPELEKQYGERAVEAHTLRRVYANIRLRDFDTDEVTTNMAVAYTQKGIQVGFGRNVKLCHNMCFLGSGRFVADYGAGKNVDKQDLNGIMRTIGGWLTNAEKMMIEDDETIERMKHAELTAEQIYTILGMLQTIRVAHDTSIKSIRFAEDIYPLNQAQLTKFTEALMVKRKQEGTITAWTLYNCATDLYKPETAEVNLIMPQNMAMVEFMKKNQIY